jgi:cell division septation protein DedD
MSPDRGPRFSGDEPGDDNEDLNAPRSIFSAPWFRAVVVLLGVAVVGAVAVPYVLDIANPPSTGGANTRTNVTSAPATTTATTTSAAPVAKAAPTPAPTTTPAPARTAAPTPATTTAKPKDTKEPTRKERPAPARARAAEGGDYFVQVGAFKEPEAAKRLAARLREQNYPVDESVKRSGGGAPIEAPRPAPRPPAATPSDRYDVIVSGGAAADINNRLATKGLAAEPAGDGVRIRPSLPLRDAVALSKDLSGDGFKVQVRRGGGGAEPMPAPARSIDSARGQTLYRVRVGGYPDRATAQGVLRELQAKGYEAFLAKGRE